MKAMVIDGFGGPEAFRVADVPEPSAGPGQVVIRVAATSVNPIDTKIRSGAVAAVCPDFPAVLHGDVAGTIERVGDGVSGFEVGDEVFAFAGGVKGYGGALAELMVADAALVAPKPGSLSLRQSAALPVVAITAWEALIERVRIEPGRKVLVHAGAGGVGHIGVQLAKLAGAVVHTTVSSGAKADVARGLGADVTINYRQQAVEHYVAEHTGGEGFDVVFDTVGGDCLAASFAAARRGGTVVSIAARSTQDLTPLHSKGLTLHVVFTLTPLLTRRGLDHHGQILRTIAGLIDSGRIEPLLNSSEFSFDTIGEAHARLEAGGAIGKIVVDARF